MTGCATIISKFSDPLVLNLTSEPSGAEVQTDIYGACRTPCKLKIDGKKEFDITVKAPGYDTIFYNSETSLNLTTLLNLFFGIGFGAIGAGIDYYNDEFHTIDDQDIFFELSREDAEDGNQEEKDSEKGDEETTTVKKEVKPPKANITDKNSVPVPPVPSATGSINTPEGKHPQKDVRLPKSLTPAEKKRLAERFSTEDVHERIVQYYGNLPTAELRRYEDRVYAQLKSMEDQGEALDLDEAVRRDWFLHQGQKAKD